MCSDDPDTILSYGILSQYLIEKLYKEYEIHYLSLQYPIGKKIERRNDKGTLLYTKYPAHNDGQRNPKNLPNVFRRIKPHLFWTNFDIQHYNNVKQYVPKGANWVGWLPWDNHDPRQIGRAKEAFQFVDYKVAISKFGMDFMKQHGIDIEEYIYNIVDPDIFYQMPKDHSEIEKFKKMNSRWYNDDIQVILFVGRPNWRKRMVYMLSIMKELVDRGNKNIRLFLHSSLDDPASEAPLRQIIDSLNLQNYVINTTFTWDEGVSRGDLRTLYNIADLYISPHAGEGFGMPIVEAMSCGTPFVASDICTTREFAGEFFERGLPSEVSYPQDNFRRPVLDKGVFRPNPDVYKFADKVEQLLSDDKRRKKMGENGIKWVKENCAPGLIARKWDRIFQLFSQPITLTDGYK